MKVAFAVHQFLPHHVTGTEQYVRSLAVALRRRGHDVRVFAREPQIHEIRPDLPFLEEDQEVDGVPVRRAAVRFDLEDNPELHDQRNVVLEDMLRRFVAGFGAEVVHVFHARGIGTGAIDVPRSLGVPVVVNLMDFWFLCPRFTLLRSDGALCDGPPRGGLGCLACIDPAAGARIEDEETLAALETVGEATPAALAQGGVVVRAAALLGRKERLLAALARADAVVAPSRFLLDTFARHGFERPRIRHVPYGVDPGRLEGFERRAQGDGRLVLGYVGSLTPHKGALVLVEAVRRIEDERLRLVLHGSLETHPDYAERLLEAASGDERIRFAGAFEPTRLGEVLSGVDALVVPSLWHENTPFTVLEARFAGLPVVASDTGGIREVVRPGRDGFLFEPGSVEALVERIEALLDDPDALAAIGPPERRRTLEENVDEFLGLYAEVSGAGSSASESSP